MKKIFLILVALTIFSSNCFAMIFSQPVEVGEIGFPIQSPYHGYVVKGAKYNDGVPYHENEKFIGKPMTTYTEGTARFGVGEDALYCVYKYGDNSYIKFGGKNNCTISISGHNTIYKINTDRGLTLYMMRLHSGTSHFDIIGRQKDGRWFYYIDTLKISGDYFNGQETYKSSDGVIYEEPKFQNDVIIIPYKYQSKFKIVARGEFRFKWDETAQWFGIEQVVY